MKAYSPDLRAKILAAVDAGMSKSQAARTFGVGLATIKRYAARRRDTGSLAPTRPPGRPPIIGSEQQEILRAQLLNHPAAYLDEHCLLLETTAGMRVSTTTMSRAIGKLGWTRKKGRWVPPSATSPNDGSGTG